ncbi:MAG: hypothetical protein HZA31_06460 [Opitutae bacterium]|nr:hypothetical protein [Opitutae bacterium]
MNCRQAQRLLLTERDHALAPEQTGPLAAHLATCPECAAYRATLLDASAMMRTAATQVPAPDATEEWLQLRARLRTPVRRETTRRLAPFAWLGLPLAAAAALAFYFFAGQPYPVERDGDTTTELARAEFVEVKDASASTMVYVDKESGWLVVWAVDGSAKG